MPRLDHRLLVDKEQKDLSILIEQLLLYVAGNGGLDSVGKINKKLLENLFSFYKKIGDLKQEEVNILWESANELVKNLMKRKPNDLVESVKLDDKIEKDNILYGKYWIFPGKKPVYLNCDDHVDFARKNGNLFMDLLGVDTYDYLHAVNSGQMNVLPLIFSAGGIMAEFVMEGKKKVGRFQLAQVSFPWLKSKLNKMPIYRSHVRVLDPTEDYTGPQNGIYFSFRRVIKD